MKQIDFHSNHTVRPVLALGYFDCVHIGHRFLFEQAKLVAKEQDLPFAVITFDNDPFVAIHSNEHPIYDYQRRLELFENCGVDLVVKAHFDRAFRDLSPQDFLDTLWNCVQPYCVVCGSDYRFGSKATGDIRQLQEYCVRKGTRVSVVDFLLQDGVKVSSREIRKLLQQGQIEHANRLLQTPYFIHSCVEHGRGEGRFYACPTANLPMSSDCGNLSYGVYGTVVTIDGKDYYGVTNVGRKPTFDDHRATIETNVIDYNGDLYGKLVTISFIKRLRDVMQFTSKELLYEQIKKDKEWYK